MPKRFDLSGADLFLSGGNEPKKPDKDDTQKTQRTHETHRTHEAKYRVNLKLRPEYKEYLSGASWAAHKSITEYINQLIADDMEKNKKPEG